MQNPPTAGTSRATPRIRLIHAQSPAWREECIALAPPGHVMEPALHLPAHFLQVTLPRLQGAAYQVLLPPQAAASEEVIAAYGYLLPRQRTADGTPVYTARNYRLPVAEQLTENALAGALRSALAAEWGGGYVVLYEPEADHTYSETHETLGPVDIGSPAYAEALEIPLLHQRVWGSESSALYPADVASNDFAAGSALVARVEGRTVGFLLGFYKLGGSKLPNDWDERFGGGWRLESQIMGVLQEHRGLRIANLLKKAQADQALAAGINIINWTADPLQYPNAALNFGLLRAVAFDFYADLYPFRNELNRVPASRFGLTWMVSTQRVQEQPMIGARASVFDLGVHRNVPRANDGCTPLDFAADAEIVAIEIPAEWTRMQAEDVALAQQWRAATDALFARLIGIAPGQYVITGVGIDGERRFLIAEAARPALWEQLGGMP